MITKLLLASAATAAVLAARPAPPALDDATIVAIFDAANGYDIVAGQLALKQSQTKAVRDLAQQFVHDHTVVRQQGRDLAAKLHVKPTPPAENPLAPDHEKAIHELQGLSGTAFDRAYAAEEVRFHQQVLDAVRQTLLPATKDSSLRAFVQQVAPAFQGHLEAAKRLQRELTSAEKT